MKYLIGIDLDGTLLDNYSKISDKTLKVIQELIKLGHKIVLATGRPFSSALKYYEELNLKTPMINDNGGFISSPYDKSFIEKRITIPLGIAHNLFKFSKPYLYSAFFSINEDVYAYNYEPRVEFLFSGLTERNVVTGDLDKINVSPTGMIYLIHFKYKETFESHFLTNFSDTLGYRLWGYDRKYAIYEIYLKSVSKYTALKEILEYYHLNDNQLLCFGDGLNDIEMIEKSHIGVALKNATDEVLAVANMITKETNHHDGLANFLISFFKLEI